MKLKHVNYRKIAYLVCMSIIVLPGSDIPSQITYHQGISKHHDWVALLLPVNHYASVLKYNNLGKMCGECVFPSVNSSSRALTDSCCSCHSQTSNLLHWIWASRDQQWLVIVLRYAFAKKKNKFISYRIKFHSLLCLNNRD